MCNGHSPAGEKRPFGCNGCACNGRGRWPKPTDLFWCGNIYDDWYYPSSPPQSHLRPGVPLERDGLADYPVGMKELILNLDLGHWRLLGHCMC